MPKKIQSGKEKFEIAIEKICSEQYSESVGKAQLTKIVNQWKEEASHDFIKKTIEDVLLTLVVPPLAEWILRKYTYVAGYFWLENSSNRYGDTVLGWYDPRQIQAEPLPLELHRQRHESDRYCKVLDWGVGWKIKGFAAAQNLPLNWGDSRVTVSAELLRSFASFGYASPCDLQWERRCYQTEPERNGLYVTRTIISHGFWQSWKWWPEAWIWYYEHRPELFEEEEVWGQKDQLVRHDPPTASAAVFSPNNSEFAKFQLFYID